MKSVMLFQFLATWTNTQRQRHSTNKPISTKTHSDEVAEPTRTSTVINEHLKNYGGRLRFSFIFHFTFFLSF